MAFKKFGDGNYRFSFQSGEAAAIAAAVGLKPQELRVSGEPEFVAEALDEEGEVAAMAVGQDKKTFTMDGYITNPTLFEEEGLDFTFDGRFYIVTGRERTVATREYEKGQLSGVSHAGVTAEIST
jgi:hypothetical protein